MAGQPLDARAAHWWKLEMDGIAGAAKKQASGSNPMGMTTTTAAQIKQDAGALRDVLADVIPDYGNALKTYADASKTMKAYRAGLKGGTRMGDVEAMPQFVNAKAEDVAAFMASLSPEEQAAYRAGSVQDVMRNTEDGTAAAKRVTRMLGNPTESGKYRQLFAPDATGDDAFAKFVAGGKVQRNQRLTEEEVIGSAKTAARQEAQRALTGDEPLTEQAAKSGIRQALESRFWRWLAQRRLGEAAGGVAERLTPMQRQQVEDLLASLAKFQTLRAGANPSLRAFGNAGALIGSGTGRTPR
jgi:hypothetical protein